MTRYQIQRRRKTGPVSNIEDPAFRSRCIAVASTGASRRTVAATVGLPEATLRTWINRGLAYPTEEPWGSFSRDYGLAERGIAAAIADTTSMRAQLVNEMMRKRLDWEVARGPKPPKPRPPKKPGKGADDIEREMYRVAKDFHDQQVEAWQLDVERWETPPPTPEVADMLWLERLRISRFPRDYGTSKHREPEPDHDGAAYLDEHAMTREQLAALFCDPPEVMRAALQDSARQVFEILVSGGFNPNAPVPVDTPEGEG